MPKRTVLDIGNCPPDHASLKRLLTTHFDVEVLQTHAAQDSLEQLKQQQPDLVLINRKLDCDYSDGTEILKCIKSDSALSQIPVMIVTNYPDHQDAAVALGAERGFGKLELNSPATLEKLSVFLQ